MCDAEVMWLAGCRGAWFCVVRLAGSVFRGPGCAFGLVGQAGVRGGALVPCPLGVPVPRGSVGWGGVVPSAVLGPLPSCPFAFVSSAVLRVAAVSPSPSGVRAVASVWWSLLLPGSSPGG